MSGNRLNAAKRALIDLVDRLDDRDRFGLVVFDHEAAVAVPAGRLADLGRDQVRRAIAGVETRGSTDLSSGYLRGLQEARRVATAAGATLVLLSDGHANAGVTDPVQLRGVAARSASQGITTSTIGIGLGYDESILAEVAIGGTGNHAFAQDPDDAAAAVAAEIDGLLSKTVQAANLLIEPTGDVSAVTILNDVVANRVEGGILVELGDFYAGEQRRITCTIDVPAMAALGLAQVATLTLTHVEVATLEQHVVTLPVTVNIVPLDVARGRVASPEVTREKLFLAAQSAKRSVEEALRSGDVPTARARLASASELLTSADMDELGAELASEVDWLNATAGMLDDSVAGAPPDIAYTSRRVSSDRTRKSRGYKTRSQGGETTSRDPDDEV
jgi:Ca-activated chloride channel family protein